MTMNISNNGWGSGALVVRTASVVGVVRTLEAGS
jgi:hypothetical protein